MDTFTTLEICIYSFVFLICILSNILVIVSILRNNEMRTITNLLIVNLSLCDFLTAIFTIPFQMAINSSGIQKFPFGKLACKTLWPGATYLYNASVFTLVAIAIERFLAICMWRRSIRKNHVIYVLVLVHISAVVIVIPYSRTLTLVSYKGSEFCYEEWIGESLQKWYTVILFLTQYVIPLALIVSLYSKSWYTIHKQNRKTIRMSECFAQPSNGGKKSTFITISRKLRFKKIKIKKITKKETSKKISFSSKAIVNSLTTTRNRQTKRALWMFATIVVIFAIFSLPNQIHWLLQIFSPDNKYQRAPREVASLFKLMIFTNSMVNCWIYMCFNENFLNSYKSTLKHLIPLFKTEKEINLTSAVASKVTEIYPLNSEVLNDYEKSVIKKLSVYDNLEDYNNLYDYNNIYYKIPPTLQDEYGSKNSDSTPTPLLCNENR